ncbi:MAG: pantetheine-phosphate adenylyltransferase [Prevotella sp.]
MNCAVFVGSFDPFTIGHYDILRRALPLFDHVVVGVGVNGHKQCLYSAEERVGRIAALYADEPKVTVEQYCGLTVDFARRHGAAFIIKGVRNIRDFEYEREQADVNRRISGIDTLLLIASPALASVSSSVVRELIHYGKDVSAFLP